MAARLEGFVGLAVVVAAVVAGWPSAASAQGGWKDEGEGTCIGADGRYPNRHTKKGIATEVSCQGYCANQRFCAGLTYWTSDGTCRLYGTGLSRSTQPGPDWLFVAQSGKTDDLRASGDWGGRCSTKIGWAKPISALTCPANQHEGLVGTGSWKTECKACDSTDCGSGKFRTGTCNTLGKGYKCNPCSNMACSTGEYRTGICEGTINAYNCKTCSNMACPTGLYRVGICNGTTNGYSCQPCPNTECGMHQFRTGTCDDVAGPGFKCRTCKMITCPAGQYRDPSFPCTEATKKFRCITCPDGKYREGTSNPQQDSPCVDQPRVIGPGELQAKNGQECEGSPSFDNVNNELCCPAGYYVAAALKDQRLECKTCSKSYCSYRRNSYSRLYYKDRCTYTNSSGQSKCLEQQTCGLGVYYKEPAAPTEERGQCVPCKAFEYRSDRYPHREPKCNAQPMCGPGEYYSASATQPREVAAKCEKCQQGKFINDEDHRLTACFQNGFVPCPKGQHMINKDSATSNASCVKCTDKNPTYKYPNRYHKRYYRYLYTDTTNVLPACKEQEEFSCSVDEFWSPDPNRQRSACLPQPRCGMGEKLAPRTKEEIVTQKQGKCEPCADGTYQDRNGTKDGAFITACQAGWQPSTDPSKPDFVCHKNPQTDPSCIVFTWKCDGWADCNNGEDEEGCTAKAETTPTTTTTTTPPVKDKCPDGFLCGSGKCIDSTWQCDGMVDCTDMENGDSGEDEKDCVTTTTTTTTAAAKEGKPCGEETFRSTEGGIGETACKPCRSCRRGTREVSPCRTDADRVCRDKVLPELCFRRGWGGMLADGPCDDRDEATTPVIIESGVDQFDIGHGDYVTAFDEGEAGDTNLTAAVIRTSGKHKHQPTSSCSASPGSSSSKQAYCSPPLSSCCGVRDGKPETEWLTQGIRAATYKGCYKNPGGFASVAPAEGWSAAACHTAAREAGKLWFAMDTPQWDPQVDSQKAKCILLNAKPDDWSVMPSGSCGSGMLGGPGGAAAVYSAAEAQFVKLELGDNPKLLVEIRVTNVRDPKARITLARLEFSDGSAQPLTLPLAPVASAGPHAIMLTPPVRTKFVKVVLVSTLYGFDGGHRPWSGSSSRFPGLAEIELRVEAMLSSQPPFNIVLPMLGEHTFSYHVADTADPPNAAYPEQRTVVIQDETPPAISPNEPAIVKPGDPVKVDIEQGDCRYFKPLCKVLTKTLIINVQDLSGKSSVFISTVDKNPTAFEYEWQDIGDSKSKVIVVDRDTAESQLYIGVKSDSSSPTRVEIAVYNDLFPGNEQKTLTIHEAEPANFLCLAAPTPAFVDGISRQPLRFTLTSSGGEEANANFPFTVDSNTGEVRTKRPLMHAENEVWTLDLRASSTTDECLRGFIKLIINVNPITATSTAPAPRALQKNASVPPSASTPINPEGSATANLSPGAEREPGCKDDDDGLCDRTSAGGNSSSSTDMITIVGAVLLFLSCCSGVTYVLQTHRTKRNRQRLPAFNGNGHSPHTVNNDSFAAVGASDAAGSSEFAGAHLALQRSAAASKGQMPQPKLPARVPESAGYERAQQDPFDLDEASVAIDRSIQLGHGNYGVVYRGTITFTAPAIMYAPVAIKMLPENRVVEQRERQEFWEEIKFLRELQRRGAHPNIVDFVGYVIADSMAMVLEFATHGSLLAHLRKQEGDRGVNTLPDREAIPFALQIATGMEYIARNQIVHRDLAARNILLTSAGQRSSSGNGTLTCKITDFGLARDIHGGDYVANAGYRTSNPTAFKWTSLEGLRHHTYTIQGDVWSFGVVLMEICSLGDTPYMQYRGFSLMFVDFLKGGGRMEKRPQWSAELYDVMVDCWQAVPAERPSFKKLVQTLAALAAPSIRSQTQSLDQDGYVDAVPAAAARSRTQSVDQDGYVDQPTSGTSAASQPYAGLQNAQQYPGAMSVAQYDFASNSQAPGDPYARLHGAQQYPGAMSVAQYDFASSSQPYARLQDAKVYAGTATAQTAAQAAPTGQAAMNLSGQSGSAGAIANNRDIDL